MERFGQSLLNETDPPISGLDKSVLIPPRRLHLTLGVMSLANTSSTVHTEGTIDSIQPRTPDDAVRFLESLKSRVDDLIRVPVSASTDRAQKIRVTLNSMDTMKLEDGGAAHVLWIGPKDGNSKDITDEETNRLRRVCGESPIRSNERAGSGHSIVPSDFIHTSFKEAGFLVEENRPLKVCSLPQFAFFNLHLVLECSKFYLFLF